MPVVFDEVIADVAPPPAAEPPPGPEAREEHEIDGPVALRRELRRVASRDARLRAD
jgi:hypothetical protein